MRKKNRRIHNMTIEHICIIFVIVLAVFFLLYLGILSLVYTQTDYNLIQQDYIEEFMPRLRDSIKDNLLFIILYIGIVSGIGTLIGHFSKQRVPQILLYISAGVGFFFGLVYVVQLHAIPWADSDSVYQAAQQFLQGNYSYMNAGNYLGIYPQQLGLVWVMEFLILIWKQNAILAFQILNVICIPIIMIMGYKIVEKLWNNAIVSSCFVIIQAGCMPLYFYVSFIYGEVLSLAFVFISLYLGICCIQQKKALKSSILLAITSCLSVSLRMNSIIPLLALGIVIFVRLLSGQKQIVIGLMALLASLLLSTAIRNIAINIYTNDSVGMPALCWIAMGLQDGDGYGYGAYNAYSVQTFEQADYDSYLASKIALDSIRSSLDYFSENPTKGIEFIKEKVNWQWLNPSFGCFSQTRFHNPEPEGIAYAINYGHLREPIADFMNGYQSFLYLGTALGSIWILYKSKKIENTLFLIIFLGGFLFSILWEAMPRYNFPYFVFLVPCAAYGIVSLTNFIISLFHRNK